MRIVNCSKKSLIFLFETFILACVHGKNVVILNILFCQPNHVCGLKPFLCIFCEKCTYCMFKKTFYTLGPFHTHTLTCSLKNVLRKNVSRHRLHNFLEILLCCIYIASCKKCMHVTKRDFSIFC